MNILIVGDSFSHKCGFSDPNGKLWLSLLIENHDITNLSFGGQSNYKIFSKVTEELIRNPKKYDLVIVQWSSLFRLTLNDNSSIYDNPVICNISSTSDSELKAFHKLWVKRFTHGRVEIEEFLTLVTSVTHLLEQVNKPYIFIKTFENFITDLNFKNWQDCSSAYKQTVLCMDKYPDWEIAEVHRNLYNLSVNLRERSCTKWINLDSQCWQDQIIDYADDQGHPGIQTNKVFYQQVVDFAKRIGIHL